MIKIGRVMSVTKKSSWMQKRSILKKCLPRLEAFNEFLTMYFEQDHPRPNLPRSIPLLEVVQCDAM